MFKMEIDLIMQSWENWKMDKDNIFFLTTAVFYAGHLEGRAFASKMTSKEYKEWLEVISEIKHELNNALWKATH